MECSNIDQLRLKLHTSYFIVHVEAFRGRALYQIAFPLFHAFPLGDIVKSHTLVHFQVVGPLWHLPQLPFQEVVGALGFSQFSN